MQKNDHVDKPGEINLNIQMQKVIGLGDVLQSISGTAEKAESVQLIRKPTFCFIFDDGTSGDVNAKALFDSYGFKCGFAIVATSDDISTKDRYLGYQSEGFEILSHSINSTAFDTVTDMTTAESYLKTSLERLKTMGFKVKGWVTPSTWLLAEQMPLVKKYYQYGYGHLTGNPTGVSHHAFFGADVRQLDRWSLQSNPVEDTLSAIDATISDGGYMIFYGHSYPQTSDNMTEENMETILTYLKTKVTAGQIIVGTPSETINNFYAIRHSDLLELYNSIHT